MKQSNKGQEKAVKLLDEGIERIRNSEEFKNYLTMAAKFPTYSPNNQLLIWAQIPEATRVATYKNWQKSHNRTVKGNERGAIIFTPRPFTRKAKSEDEEDTNHLGFGVAYVFDVTQTEGEALATLDVKDVKGDDDAGLFKRLKQVAKSENVSVTRGKNGSTENGVKGWYNQTKNEIWIRPNMSPAMRAKTLAHELGHHFAQHATNGHCTSERECIAESVAFIVTTHFGLDSGDYSFSYIAGWSDQKVFKDKLIEINKSARSIIEKVNEIR
jgi:hypothetical protein